MLKNQKAIFGFLCVIMIGVNGFQHLPSLGEYSLTAILSGGIGGSLLSIPLWSCIGVVLGNIGLFFWKIVKPSKDEVLSLIQKASLGLIAGILIKPIYGILW